VIKIQADAQQVSPPTGESYPEPGEGPVSIIQWDRMADPIWAAAETNHVM
jgi:hypothetical protein